MLFTFSVFFFFANIYNNFLFPLLFFECEFFLWQILPIYISENVFILPSFFLIFQYVCESHSVISNSLRLHGLYSPWSSPGQTTGGGSLSFLQRIFLTQELNQSLLHCRQILYHLSYQERIQYWQFFYISTLKL